MRMRSVKNYLSGVSNILGVPLWGIRPVSIPLITPMDDYCLSYLCTYNHVYAGIWLDLGYTEITKINTHNLCLQVAYSLFRRLACKWLYMAMIYIQPGCASTIAWMFANFPPKLIYWNLTPTVRALEDGPLGRWIGPEGASPLNGISALVTKIPEISLIFSTKWEQVRR